MPFSSILSRFIITGSPAFYDQTVGALTAIYEGSPRAASAIDSWLAADSNRKIEVTFSSGEAKADVNTGKIWIDPAFVNYYVSSNGTTVQDTFLSTLAHELGHAVTVHDDHISLTDLAGPNVLNVNGWFAQLGIEKQISYQAQDDGNGVLIKNYSYTSGSAISTSLIDKRYNKYLKIDTGIVDLTSAGTQGPALIIGSNDINWYQGTTRDDWIYGNGGGDLLLGGDGQDTIYGGTGDDTLIGGKGSDELWGGDKGQNAGLSDGDDRVSYVSSKSPIRVRFDGTGASAVLTVSDGSGGTDTLHSIEEILGTSGFDTLTVVGRIPTNTELEIDAYGGQSSSGSGQIINGRGVTATGLKIEIDSEGNGYVGHMGGSGGQIDLTGFHTQVVASGLDDDISDDSDGKKRIDGGLGDDIISTAGTDADVLLIGGWGDDTLTGGSGNDTMIGGLITS